MHMPVGDATDRLTRQARQIVVLDLIGLGVEEIEHVKLKLEAVVEPVAGARVENQR
jgi:hypothetical protein